MPRRAFAADEYKRRQGEGIVKQAPEAEVKRQAELAVKAFVKLVKLKKEEQEITGVVLEPDTFDAQKTTISKKVIKKAAHKFLANYNKTTKIGVQHEDFTKPFELNQSFIAPCDLVIGTKTIKEGSWVVVLKVLDSKIWAKIKKGEITGFSIGGKAKIRKLEKEQSADENKEEAA